MKSQRNSRSPGGFWGALAVAALAVIWGASAVPSAEAVVTAGNTLVRNTISVDYRDTKGNVQATVSSFVDITVNTVAATPTVLSFTPAAGNTDGAGTTQPFTVRVRTNSNGPGSVSFATADNTSATISPLGAIPSVPGNIYLGSTIFDPSNFPAMGAQSVTNNTTIVVAVPNDNGKADDAGAAHALPASVINGLALNDIVYITDGVITPLGPWQVTALSEPAAVGGNPPAPGSLTLKNISGGTLAFTPAYGWDILEAKDVTVTVTQGTVTLPTAAASWTTTVTATMAGAAGGSNTVTTNAHMGVISVTKYVRNVTTPIAGAGLFSPPVFTNNFYTSGVSGKPGEILEYLAVISDAGTGNSTAVYATDVMPTYSTLLTGASYGTGSGLVFAQANFLGTGVVLKTDNSVTGTNVAFGKSSGTSAGSTMNFYLGTGCTASVGGALTPGQTIYLVYQVKID